MIIMTSLFFEKFRFQTVFRQHQKTKPLFSNSSGLKSFFEKLRFRDGLVWTVFLSYSSGVMWTGPKFGFPNLESPHLESEVRRFKNPVVVHTALKSNVV